MNEFLFHIRVNQLCSIQPCFIFIDPIILSRCALYCHWIQVNLFATSMCLPLLEEDIALNAG